MFEAATRVMNLENGRSARPLPPLRLERPPFNFGHCTRLEIFPKRTTTAIVTFGRGCQKYRGSPASGAIGFVDANISCPSARYGARYIQGPRVKGKLSSHGTPEIPRLTCCRQCQTELAVMSLLETH